jgi:hypothetical protein
MVVMDYVIMIVKKSLLALFVVIELLKMFFEKIVIFEKLEMG